MNPFVYLPILAKQRQAEMLKEAEQMRLLSEAFKLREPAVKNRSKFLAFIGRELESLGFSLEVRYGGQSDLNGRLSQQSSPGGCA